MKKTKIDWCDCTLNPVIGCKNNCKYCYAKKQNDRFHFVPNWCEPQFFPERLKQLNCRKPKSIFMDSMSDVGWWEKDWGRQVYETMHKNPQHNYIFLTKGGKYPSGFHEILELCAFYENKNIFFGKSITMNGQYNCSEQYDFISIEPILEPIDLSAIKYTLYTRQVIIGAETGNRKGKVIPKKEWIDDIVKQCDIKGVRVFMKSSLKEIMGKDFRQDKLIWDIGGGDE